MGFRAGNGSDFVQRDIVSARFSPEKKESKRKWKKRGIRA
jgi:hypothetical protein